MHTRCGHCFQQSEDSKFESMFDSNFGVEDSSEELTHRKFSGLATQCCSICWPKHGCLASFAGCKVFILDVNTHGRTLKLLNRLSEHAFRRGLERL